MAAQGGNAAALPEARLNTNFNSERRCNDDRKSALVKLTTAHQENLQIMLFNEMASLDQTRIELDKKSAEVKEIQTLLGSKEQEHSSQISNLESQLEKAQETESQLTESRDLVTSLESQMEKLRDERASSLANFSEKEKEHEVEISNHINEKKLFENQVADLTRQIDEHHQQRSALLEEQHTAEGKIESLQSALSQGQQKEHKIQLALVSC